MSERLERLWEALDDTALECMLITKIENVRYLTGFSGSNGAVLVTPDAAVLITDGRYREQAAREAPGWDVFIYTKTMARAVADNMPQRLKCGFEVTCVYDFYRKLAEIVGESRLEPLDGTVERLRAVKDASEVEHIRAALGCASEGFAAARAMMTEGMRERELAAELDYRMALAGADGPAFETVVASGPNSSLPHSPLTDRTLEPGDLVVTDFGARKDSYRSDTTRTVHLGKLDGEQRRVFGAVAGAVDAAMAEIRPGVKASDVDDAARRYISSAGYGGRFTHALGHGVGLETHERPTLSFLSTDLLEPGMLFTVEPGIYVTGWGGVRIEEMVLVTEEGCMVLTGGIPRDGR